MVKEPIPVVLVSCRERVGVAERVIWELATRLPPSRFAVRAWLPALPAFDELSDTLGEHVPVERVPDLGAGADWRAALAFWLRLRRARPALVHLHHTGPRSARLVSSLGDMPGRPPLVVSIHAWSADDHRRGFERVDHLTSPGAALAESVARACAVDLARIRVVPNGVDPPDEEVEQLVARALRERLGVSAIARLWVCAVGRGAAGAHDAMLDALAELKRRGLPFVAAFAGEGIEAGGIERRAEAIGIADAVRVVPQQESFEPLLLAADGVVVPECGDVPPHALLAAMARARPVVACARGAASEVVADGASGRLVAPGDPAGLADALEGFHRRPEAAWRLGAAAAERIAERFAWDEIVHAYEEVYDDSLGLATFHPHREAGVARR